MKKALHEWKIAVPFVVGKKPNQLLGPHEPDKSKRRDFHSLRVSLNSCKEISVSTVLFVDQATLSWSLKL